MALDFPIGVPTGTTYAGPDGAIWKWDGTKWIAVPGTATASGTVLSVATGAGLTGGPITTAGTISAVPATASTLGSVVVGSGISVTAGGTISAAAAGVTSITAGTGLTGGVITTAGTIALAPATASTLGGVIAGSGISITGGGTISVAGGGTTVTVADAAPGSPADGSMWFDSIGLQLYLRYNDGNSAQWVPTINQQGLLSDAPADGVYYTRRNNAWIGQTADPALVRTDVGRNLVHNPLFRIIQRGNIAVTTSVYTAMDRWRMYITSDTVSVQQTTLSDGQRAIIGDEEANTCFINTFTGNAAAGAQHCVSQYIEGVRRTAGKTVTVSFWAHASAAGIKLGVSFDQLFGTGGSPSAFVFLNGSSVTLTTAPVRYIVTITLPSLSGKTLGTNGDDSTGLNFWFSSGATGNVRAGSIGVQTGTVVLWGVQLEIGSVATPLEKPDPQQDLAKCQRFFLASSVTLSTYGLNGQWISYGVVFPTTMRATPTFAFSGASLTNCTGLSASVPNPSSFNAYATVTALGWAQFNANFTASADL